MSLIDEIPPLSRTWPQMLERQAAKFPDHTVFKAGDAAWTCAEARDIAAGQAAALAAAGVGFGDRVAIFCGNRPEFMRALLACAWLGAVAVPVNTAAKGPQLGYFLRNSGARLLVIERELMGVLDLADLGDADRGDRPLALIWVVGGDAPGETPATIAGCTAVAFPPPAAPIPAAAVKPGDTFNILYTSGTTGPSKGVCCPHAQSFWWGYYGIRAMEIVEGDVLCTTLPLFHTNALNAFWQAMLTGATLVVEPRFSASGFWPSLAKHKATVTYVLGAMVPILLARPESAEERAHTVRIGLGPGVPGKLHTEFTRRTGIPLVDGYGMTETNFIIGSTPREIRPGYMGTLNPGFQARVVDGDDNELPAGEPGELIVRADAPFVFATGYFNMPEKTVEAWRNLWFHSGDRVVREADGYYRFVDRLKDTIRRRGENISSFEVEQVILSHPAIETAAAFPVKSELAEDEVMIALVLRAGAALTPVELMDFCAPRLPYFAVPRFVAIVPDLPRTESGKIQKFKLREAGITPGAWDRDAAGYVLKRR